MKKLKGFKMDMFRGESYAVQGIGFVSKGCGLGDSNWSPFASDAWDDDNMGISADLITAQAVSSLQISENSDEHTFVFNRLFRG